MTQVRRGTNKIPSWMYDLCQVCTHVWHNQRGPVFQFWVACFEMMTVIKKGQQIIKIVSFMSEVHHVCKSTLTKCNPVKGSLKGAILLMRKSHDLIAVYKEGPKVYSGPLF